MKELVNRIKSMIFSEKEQEHEFLCNQVLNYNNFGHKGEKDSVELYDVCKMKS